MSHRSILDQLAERHLVTAPVMIVVAHPDDETIGMGAKLCRFEHAVLVHVTDGAPRDGRDARAYGFASVEDYAAARRRELAAALAAGGASGLQRIELGVPDQEAVRRLPSLVRELGGLMRQLRPAAVFTHAYEGGHPDHDAVAFAVHAACDLSDAPPPILEFPLYDRADGVFTTGRFISASSRRRPGSTDPLFEMLNHGSRPAPGRREEVVLPLGAEERARKQRMIECFVTQQGVLRQFAVENERFRLAPEYDFTQLPHPGQLNYEVWNMPIGGAEWRDLAAAAWHELGLPRR